MSRSGKCHNYQGCLLAYRGEITAVPEGQPFVCAECSQPLTQVKASAKKWITLAVALAAIPALALVALAAWPKLQGALGKKPSLGASAATPAATPAREAEIPVINPEKMGDAEPPPTVVAPPKVTLQVDETVKREVLKRIDLMPKVTQANKDKLYNSVERVVKMGLVLTVPFDKGKTAVSPKDGEALKAALETPDTMTLRNSPTAVFIVLGYADPKGDAKANLAYSQSRADAVVGLMKRDAAVQNVVHPVAMGGSSLLDEKNLEKNRIAEVWVVLP